MKFQLAAALSLWLALPLPAAGAQAAACATPQVQPSPTLPARWQEPVAQLCAALSQRRDLDPQAQLRIEPAAGETLVLRATLGDGRTTERSVDSEAALTRTAEALLLLPLGPPPTAAEAAPAPAPPSAAAAPAPPSAAAAPPASEPEPTAPKPPDFSLHVRLGINAIGHVAGTPAYLGGGFSAMAGLRLRMFLFEISPQWEAEQVSARMRLPDFEMHNFGLSAVVGLRFWESPDGAAEVALGVLFLLEDQTYRPVTQEVGGSLVDGQVTAWARLLWGEAPLRWSVALNLAIAPARLAREAHIRDIFPALPSVAVGVAFGAHWEST